LVVKVFGLKATILDLQLRNADEYVLLAGSRQSLVYGAYENCLNRRFKVICDSDAMRAIQHRKWADGYELAMHFRYIYRLYFKTESFRGFARSCLDLSGLSCHSAGWFSRNECKDGGRRLFDWVVAIVGSIEQDGQSR